MPKFSFGWRPARPFAKTDLANPPKYVPPPVTAIIVAKESKVSIFSSIESVLSKVEGKVPAVISVASLTLSSLSVVVESILDVTGQEAEASAIASAVAIAQGAMAAVSATMTAAGGSTATIASTLQAVVANLQSLLTAGQIKNSTVLAQVTALVNLAATEIENVIKAL